MDKDPSMSGTYTAWIIEALRPQEYGPPKWVQIHLEKTLPPNGVPNNDYPRLVHGEFDLCSYHQAMSIAHKIAEETRGLPMFLSKNWQDKIHGVRIVEYKVEYRLNTSRQDRIEVVNAPGRGVEDT